jgi:adenine-specific DNA methylase
VTPTSCKRLIEVDFLIAKVSEHSAREKANPAGHPTRLHLWWARRPLAACRVLLLGLLPAPTDRECPADFTAKARVLLSNRPSQALPTETILPSPNEKRIADDRRDLYRLYIVTHCDTAPTLQDPIKDPARFPWHEVRKVEHYKLEVNALTEPMQLKEDPPPYGGEQ